MTYGEKLPRRIKKGIRERCQFLDKNGCRCRKRAKIEYHCFEDPCLGSLWIVTNLCKEHSSSITGIIK